MSSGEVVCRFCLNQLNIHKKSFDIDENISRLFFAVTGIELSKSRTCPTISCELCIRSLQYFSSLKAQLIENQYTLLKRANTLGNKRPAPKEKDPIAHEPVIEYKKFSDDEGEQESEEPTIAKRIKQEKNNDTSTTVWLADSITSETQEDLLPIAPDQECLYCPEKLPNTSALKKHLKDFHSNQDVSEQLLRCPFKNCQSSFKMYSTLMEHKKKHLENMSITCKICGKICMSKDQLRAHMKYHQDPKFKCFECNVSFFESQQLKNHNLNKHENVRNHQCPMCDKTYFKKTHLSRHIKITHQKQTINCNVPDCTRVYTRRERVIAHISKQHPELGNDEIEFFIGELKTTPYNYGIPDNSTISLCNDQDQDDEEDSSDEITVEEPQMI